MPVYLSLVAPLAGTESFWEELGSGGLAPNLRLRDLDGETICYARMADGPEAVPDFVDRMFRRPWSVVGTWNVLLKAARRVLAFRTFNPILWYVAVASTLHCFLWARAYPSQRRTYLAGEGVLDPQYAEHPPDISAEDRARYFEPVALTDADGRPAEWLRPYLAARAAADAPAETPREGAAATVGGVG